MKTIKYFYIVWGLIDLLACKSSFDVITTGDPSSLLEGSATYQSNVAASVSIQGAQVDLPDNAVKDKDKDSKIKFKVNAITNRDFQDLEQEGVILDKNAVQVSATREDTGEKYTDQLNKPLKVCVKFDLDQNDLNFAVFMLKDDGSKQVIPKELLFYEVQQEQTRVCVYARYANFSMVAGILKDGAIPSGFDKIEKPAGPAQLTASADSDTKISVTWTKATGQVDGYIVSLYKYDGNNYVFASEQNTTATSVAFEKLSAETKYKVEVQAYNNSSLSVVVSKEVTTKASTIAGGGTTSGTTAAGTTTGGSTTAGSTTGGDTSLGSFSITSASSTTDTTPDITWGASSNATAYDVAVYTDSSCATTAQQSYTDVAATTKTLSTLNDFAIYYLKVTSKQTGSTLAASNTCFKLKVQSVTDVVVWADRGGVNYVKTDGSAKGVIMSSPRFTSTSGTYFDATNQKFYFVEYYVSGTIEPRIVRSNLDWTKIEGLVSGSTTLGKPADMAYDATNNKIYWIDCTTGSSKVYKANTDGTSKTTVFTVAGGDENCNGGIDIHQSKVYFTTLGNLKRANLDGTGPENLGSLGNYKRLAIDKTNDKIYYMSGDITIEVRKMNLDGTGDALISSNGGSVGDIGVDPANGKVYWSAAGSDLKRANYDGTSEEVVIAGYGTTGLVVDTVNSKLIAIQGTSSAAKRSNLDGSGAVSIEDYFISAQAGYFDQTNFKFYFSHNGVNKTYVLDLTTRTYSLLFSELAVGIAVDSSKIYFTNSSTNKVRTANLDGSSLADLITGLNSPGVITVTSSNLFFLNNGADRIVKANLDGTGSTNIITTTEAPSSLFVKSSKLYWCANASGDMQRANTDGTSPESLSTGANAPYFVCSANSDGSTRYIYYNNFGYFIYKYDGATTELTTWTSTAPNGVGIDEIWFLDYLP